MGRRSGWQTQKGDELADESELVASVSPRWDK